MPIAELLDVAAPGAPLGRDQHGFCSLSLWVSQTILLVQERSRPRLRACLRAVAADQLRSMPDDASQEDLQCQVCQELPAGVSDAVGFRHHANLHLLPCGDVGGQPCGDQLLRARLARLSRGEPVDEATPAVADADADATPAAVDATADAAGAGEEGAPEEAQSVALVHAEAGLVSLYQQLDDQPKDIPLVILDDDEGKDVVQIDDDEEKEVMQVDFQRLFAGEDEEEDVYEVEDVDMVDVDMEDGVEETDDHPVHGPDLDLARREVFRVLVIL